MYAENNEKRARRPFVRYQSRLELVNQTQSYDVISVDASVTSELVVVQQVDFVVNVGGHVFVEVVGSTNINIFQDIFVVVATTQVFTFRLQVSQGRTQTEVELVLSNSFEVLCFVRPTQGTYASCVVGLGVLSSQVDVVSVVFQTTSVGFSTVAVTDVSSGVLSISTFGAGDRTTDTETFVIISDRTADAVAVLTQCVTTVVSYATSKAFTRWVAVFTLVLNSKVQAVNQTEEVSVTVGREAVTTLLHGRVCGPALSLKAA